jgi:hypothetical protein
MATHASFLHEVPFDPYLPYHFMGEEIIMCVGVELHLNRIALNRIVLSIYMPL